MAAETSKQSEFNLMKDTTADPPYDYNQLIQHIAVRGKVLYGRDFIIDETDRPVIHKLLIYFLRDETSAVNEGIDLYKGILLTGKIGCGKTSLMTLMQSICREPYQYQIASSRDINFEFSKIGFDIIHRYSRNSFYPFSNIPKAHCFDDLGLEANVTCGGNTCNAVAEILLSRYDLLFSNKMVTHVTTNLNSQQLENTYGKRLHSRMRAMFNLIAFDINTRDKRN